MSQEVSLFIMTLKGYKVLQSLLANFPAGVIQKVVTAKDKGVLNDYSEEIIELCQQHSISVCFRTDYFEINSRWAFAVSWRWLLKLDESCRLIVFHDSLLPKYRGFSPLVSCLINGENEIGVTALFGTSEYDRGEIIQQSKSTIHYPIKIEQAINIVANDYASLAVNITSQILSNKPLQTRKQVEEDATYSLWRDDLDYRMDWNQDAVDLKRFIDAVGFPYKGALANIGANRIRVLEAEVTEDLHIENRQPGKVIFLKAGVPVVVCKKGLLKLLNIIDDQTGESIIPLNKFRIRFT